MGPVRQKTGKGRPEEPCSPRSLGLPGAGPPLGLRLAGARDQGSRGPGDAPGPRPEPSGRWGSSPRTPAAVGVALPGGRQLTAGGGRQRLTPEGRRGA